MKNALQPCGRICKPLEGQVSYVFDSHFELETFNDCYAGIQHATDDFLIQFLRSEMNDIAAAVERIKWYARMRRDHPVLFPMPSDTYEEQKNNQIYFFQPELTPAGEAIVYVQPSRWDVTRANLSQAIASFTPFIELATNVRDSEGNYVSGCVSYKLQLTPHCVYQRKATATWLYWT